MSTEVLEDNRIDLEPRMKVQSIIMEIIMLRDNLSDADMGKWADEHSRDISNVIDDPKNESIQKNIFSGNFQKAAEETIELLNK